MSDGPVYRRVGQRPEALDADQLTISTPSPGENPLFNPWASSTPTDRAAYGPSPLAAAASTSHRAGIVEDALRTVQERLAGPPPQKLVTGRSVPRADSRPPFRRALIRKTAAMGKSTDLAAGGILLDETLLPRKGESTMRRASLAAAAALVVDGLRSGLR